jgi:TonB family protein
MSLAASYALRWSFGTVLSLAALSIVRAQVPPASPAVQVCGRVIKLTCDPKKDRSTVLELKPQSKRLPVTIDPADRPAFRPSPEELFLDAEICAAGRTEVRDGKPRMLLKAPDDVTIRKPPRHPSQPWAAPAWRGCDDGVEMPALVREVKPRYPGDAMRALLQGIVSLEAIVLPDGTVGEVHVSKSLDVKHGLDAEAVRTVKQWRFKPGTKGGQAVPVIVSIEMSFTLK